MWRRLLPIPVSFCLFLLRHPVFTTLFIYIALVALHPPPRRPGLSEKEEEKDVDFLSTSSCVCKLVPIFPLHFLPPFLLLLCLLPTSFFFREEKTPASSSSQEKICIGLLSRAVRTRGKTVATTPKQHSSCEDKLVWTIRRVVGEGELRSTLEVNPALGTF